MKKKKERLILSVAEMVATYFDIDPIIGLTVSDLGDEAQAYCNEIDPYVFELEFDKKFLKTASDEDIIRATAHEMVHVKQYINDGLTLEVGKPYKFKGKKYEGDYWFSPWEIEARGHEEAFLQYFLHWRV